jgi:hypothetical protein
MNRFFSADGFAWREFLGRCPKLFMKAAPLALGPASRLFLAPKARSHISLGHRPRIKWDK